MRHREREYSNETARRESVADFGKEHRSGHASALHERATSHSQPPPRAAIAAQSASTPRKRFEPSDAEQPPDRHREQLDALRR